MRYFYIFTLGTFLATANFSPLLACDCALKNISPEASEDFN